MPLSPHRSQPTHRTVEWLQRPPARQMMADVQRLAIPELTRVFGAYGLYLRPAESNSAELSGNMLGKILTVHRHGAGLSGQFSCQDDELPISTGSLSLVYCLFMFETSPTPSALMHEVARILKPEGVALVISLNPTGLARLRWMFAARPETNGSVVDAMAREAGLEVSRTQSMGPVWPRVAPLPTGASSRHWYDALRVAQLTVLRRRESGLTPLRKAAGAVSLRPGMSAG